MKMEIVGFGEYEGLKIFQFVLKNDNGMVVKLMNYGATITSISIPDNDGKPISIACGFDKFEDYFSKEYKLNAPYFGGTIGRFSSQIKDARFTLDGHAYNLTPNCGRNNLHGGTNGFDKKVWMPMPYESFNEVGIIFTLFSQDMEEGFPGNVNAKVLIKLTNNNEIFCEYVATTDAKTPLSMTNHTYFNLSGFKQNIEFHQIKVYTSKLQEMDNSGAGTGKILDVTNTMNDLQNGKVVGDVHKALGDGFEHFYVFENQDSKLQKVAEVTEPESERRLEVFSTEPCMLFYTGKYTSDELKRNDTETYGKYRGFCCETHRVQNGPNIPDVPNTITTPEKPFESTTVFKLKF